MDDHYDDTLQKKDVLSKCSPGKLSPNVTIIWETLVREITETKPAEARELMRHLLSEAYKEESQALPGAKSFESTSAFHEALTVNILERAHAHAQSERADKQLAPFDGTPGSRNVSTRDQRGNNKGQDPRGR